MFTLAFFVAALLALLVVYVVFLIIDATGAPNPILWILKLLVAIGVISLFYKQYPF